MRDHWDFRVLRRPNANSAYSWALPKSSFPSGDEKLLAVQTPDHSKKYMSFEGNLKNGDRVEIYDSGECDIISDTPNRKIFNLLGKKVKGIFILIKTQSANENSWIILRKKSH